jgi:hypothetical protein
MLHLHRSIVVFPLVLMAIACQTTDPARKRSQDAVQALVDTRTALLVGERQVAESVQSVRALLDATGDLRPPFDAFRERLALVNKEADRVRVEAEDMRLQHTAYTGAWQQDVSTIQNQALRDIAESRASEVRERYARIDQLYGEVNTAYAQYLSNCEDLRKYLVNDLNYPAVQRAKSYFADAERSGQDLRRKITALATELGETTNVLSPVPVPHSAQATPPSTMGATTTTTTPTTRP